MNTPFIITTNSLPPVLVEPIKQYNETDIAFANRQLDYGAMISRIKLSYMKHSHLNSDAFPYTSDELAIYMLHLCVQLDAPSED